MRAGYFLWKITSERGTNGTPAAGNHRAMSGFVEPSAVGGSKKPWPSLTDPNRVGPGAGKRKTLKNRGQRYYETSRKPELPSKTSF